MDANPPTAHGLPSRRRRAFLWGVASTALSAAGLIAFALFEQYNAAVTELRTDLKRFNETSAEYVKRDQLARLREHMIQLSRDVAAANATRLALEHELQASERGREEQAKELQRTRERLAYLEGLGAAKVAAPAAPEPPH
jgi:site-specific DNA-cytosine methylase